MAKKLFIQVYEMQTWTPVTSEIVATRCLRSDEDLRRLIGFMEEKVKLFNHRFVAMSLPYQFEWIFALLPHEVEQVMTSSAPPPSKWWAKNWFGVALHSVGYRPHLRHVFEHQEQYWKVITTLWNFHQLNRIWVLQDNYFRMRVEAILNEVGNYIARGLSIDIDTLQLKFAKLDAERRVESVKFMKALPSRRSKAWKDLKGIIVAEFRYCFQKSSPGIELIGGLNCSLLEDHYWISLIKRIIRLTQIIILD